MGIKLVEEVMDHAPDSLTTGEWKGLIVLARDANDQTRQTFTPVNDPEILRRVRLKPAAWSNLRSALIRKGALEVVEAGVRGRTATYRIPIFAPPMLHPVDEALPDDNEMPHPSDEESPTTPHPTDEANGRFFTQQMTPTPPSSSTTSSSPTPAPPATAPPPSRGGGGGSQEQQPPARVLQFVDALDYRGQQPSRSQHQRLATYVDAAFAAGWTEQQLQAHLGSGLRTADSPLAIYLHRLKPDELPTRPPRGHVRPAVRVHADPTYCGENGCDYGQIEQPDGSYAPCPCIRKATAA